MYGRWEGELWFHRWHMWPVPSSSTPSVAAPSSSFVFIDTNSLSKDGRKIHVGDCALFKPPHNSLPFVGLIRKLRVGKEKNLSLSVNWLYRPADVKLKDGAPLEAAPNEVFYSFHKDEIPAASLLHPCKVTFLRKGVELPSGLSSFVCRRVYDIENECLWWLTDQDYLNSSLTQERQEEVNQLLDKTLVEMYGAAHTGSRSPKQPKPDNVQNSSSSISSLKSKKREHGVHNSDSVSVKRERLSKVDDADSGQRRPDHIIKTEINKITDKGGLVDFNGVEKLIQLMRPENTDKKLDLASRAILVDVISGTERFDLLGRFVQIRGLSVLDEWLQEIHKGKIGDGGLKENEKSVEDFLFSLLRALDRLPVNLHALQTCNVGKSVNHLRSHKNQEIQKKARSLVSTWKRRVEAEMTMIETKSSTSRGGSWPTKSMMSEVSRPKSSPLKTHHPKQISGEPAAKSPPPPPTPTSPASKQQPSTLAGSSKEGRSSSTTHSPNNSQSCSSSRNSNGNLGKSRNFPPEKDASSPARQVNVSDVSIVDNGNSHDQKVSEKTDSLNKNTGTVLSQAKDEEVKAATGSGGGSSSGVTPKPLYEPSYSSINALVESCAKFSEASVSPSANDDVGMNLLASVAAGEMSRSDVSPGSNSPLPEDSCSVNVAKLRQNDDNVSRAGEMSDSPLLQNGNAVVVTPDVKVEEVSVDAKNKEGENGNLTSTKVETQMNEESASWSSSDIQKELLDQSMVTTSGGDDDDEKTAEMDSGTSVSDHETAGKDGSDAPGVNLAAAPAADPVAEPGVKLDFDLNEDVPIDDGIQGECIPGSQNRSLITVAAPAKGPFYPSENLSRNKPELGWKGSAATSAFRPAVPDTRKARPLLDFDLNIGINDSDAPHTHNTPVDCDNGGGLGLDLNACQESPPRVVSSNSSRGFDLNNGPGVEDASENLFPKKGIPFLPNARMNNMDIGVNLSSWFPPNTTTTAYHHPAIPIPTPVLSSSPAVVPFQYSPFPFDTNFPVSTAYVDALPAGGSGGGHCFPTQGQLVSMPYRPSYFMSLPGGSSNVGKWGSQGGHGHGHGLDLNSGPGGGGDVKLPLPPPGMFQQMAATGGGGGLVLKRKEPDGGDRISYKHPSWQ